MLLLLISETVNYLSATNSMSSAFINTYFINKAISESKNGNLQNALNNLNIASRINIFGEYDPYRHLLPSDYTDKISISDDPNLKSVLEGYLANLKDEDLQKSEDQGLGKIFYTLGLLSYANSHPELTPLFFKLSIYNNPEFASFHAELINYYFLNADLGQMNKELEYCAKFYWAKTLCETYKNDSLKSNIPMPVGYMKEEVQKYYNFP